MFHETYLCWISLWLGFHTLLLYAHNDIVTAFGDSDKQLVVEEARSVRKDL